MGDTPPQGFAGGGGGGGGYTTLASASGQSGQYVFDQTPSTGGKIEATVAPSGGFVEQRSNSFANDGVPNIDARGTDFEDVLGPGEQSQVYMWERDVSSPSGGGDAPWLGPWGMTWDGSDFFHTDNDDNNLYRLDQDFNVTADIDSPAPDPRGIAWDGTEFLHADGSANYLYFLSSSLLTAGGDTPPLNSPSGVTYDGSSYFVTHRGGTPYIYEFDSDLNVVGGSSPPGGNPQGIQWDGQAFIHSDDVANYYYVLDSNLSVIGGSPSQGGNQNTRGIGWDGGEIQIPANTDPSEQPGYIYQFGGSFAFMAGLQE